MGKAQSPKVPSSLDMGDEFQETFNLQEEPGVELISTQIIPVALQSAGVTEVSLFILFSDNFLNISGHQFSCRCSVTVTTRLSANGC